MDSYMLINGGRVVWRKVLRKEERGVSKGKKEGDWENGKCFVLVGLR